MRVEYVDVNTVKEKLASLKSEKPKVSMKDRMLEFVWLFDEIVLLKRRAERLQKEKEEQEESKRMEKIAKSKAQVEESNRYYNENAKPGSLAAKANMVAKYNAKHEKGGKK